MANSDEMPPLGDSWCKTDLKTRKTSEGTFTWTISGLNEKREEYGAGQSVMSRQFTLRSPDGKETKWILEFFPRCKSSTNYLQIVVHSKNKFVLEAKVQMTIIASGGSKHFLNAGFFDAPHSCTFANESKLNIWQSDWNTLMRDSWQFTYMPNGDLTFNFELLLYGTPKSIYGSKNSNRVQGSGKSENGLQVFEDLDEFYLSKELSDVKIDCQGKMFDAHQVILAARSPVFRGMFLADMKEKKSQLVEIKDLEPKVVSEMLKFIYTRSCVATKDNENPDLEFVSDLLKASEKYQLETLKNVCQSLLSTQLKVGNSLKFLVLGDMYGAQELKNAAMDIMINNMSEIIKTEEWRECKRERPHIIMEVAEGQWLKS